MELFKPQIACTTKATHSYGWPRWSRVAILGLSATTSLCAQFNFQETFTTTEAPGWELLQGGTTPGPRLTAGSIALTQDPETNGLPLDTDGQGWLRLATRTGNQANSTFLDTPIPAAGNNVTASFDFTIWDRSVDPGTGADGLTFFFYDASVAFDAGAGGGSLGYANQTAIDGLAGGYLGLGLDVYGNFSNPTEGRNGGVGFRSSEVVLRGPGSGTTGYEYLAGTDGVNTTVGGSPAISNVETILGLGSNPLAYETQNFRPDQDAEQYRFVEIELTDTNELIVRMRAGFTGPLVELFTADVSSFTRPDLLRIGFSGGTGGVDQVYEVRNLQVETTGTSNTWYWTNATSSLWSENGNWTPVSQPADHSDLVFTDQFPDTDGPMVVLVDGADKVVRHAFLSGEYSYTINPDTTQRWEMNTDGLGASYISVLSSVTGNADHAVNVDLDLQNDLQVQHLVTDQTLTLGGDIDTNGNDLFLNSFGILEADGVISDSGDVFAQGSGTKVLTGNNTYSGQTTVEGGVLQIESNNALGSTAAGTTVEDGATLAMAGNITTPAEALSITGSGVGDLGALVSVDGDNTWQGAITLAGDSTIGSLDTTTLTLDGAINGAGNELTLAPQSGGTIEIDGVISGTGTNVIYAGEGTSEIGTFLTHTYTGTTTIRSGTLISNSSVGAFGEEAFGNSTTDIEIGDSGTLATDNISLLFNTPGFAQIVAGREININDFGADVTLGVTGNSVLFINDAVNLSRDLILSAEAGTSLVIDNDGTSGQLTGNGDITIEGSGDVILEGNQTRSGNTIINNGTLTVRAATDALDNSGRVTLANNAAAEFVVQSDETIGSLAGGGATGGNVTVDPGSTLTIGNDNTDSTFSGSVQGTGDLAKTGTGTTTFDGANTLDGNLTVSSGTVLIDADNTFADAMDLTLSGGTFATNGRSDTLDTFTLTADSAIDFRGENGGFLTFDDMTRTGGILTIDQWAGSLTGNGNTRLQVTAGTLGGALLTNTTFTGWGDAQLLDLGGGLFELVPTLSGFSVWDDGDAGNDNWTDNDNWTGGAPNGNGDRAYFGDDPAGTGAQTVLLNNNRTIGTLILDGTEHNYEMRSSGNNRTLNLRNNGDEANIIVSGNQEHIIGTSNTNGERINIRMRDDLLIQNNSTAATGLTFGTLNGAHLFRLDGNDLTVSGNSRTIIHGNIRNAGSITKDDIGILRITDTANSFTGGVTLNDGTIEIGSNAAFGTGDLTINGGAFEAFDGARDISNDFTINSAYAVNGTNDLTFSGDGTLAAGSQEITVTSGVDHILSGDLTGTGELIKAGDGTLSLTGDTKTFSGGLTVNDGIVDATRNGNITLGTADGANNIAGSGAINVNTGGTFNLTQTANNAITLRGEPLTNNGGGINITSTGDNENRDFFIGTDAVNTGQLISTGGTTTINVGDDIRVRANSSINVSGGTVNLNPADAFITEGTSGNAATIAVTNTGALNIDVTSARSDDNAVTLGEFDEMTVQGSNANVTITGQADSAIQIDGSLNLFESGRVTVEEGTTTISSTAIVDGGTIGDSGTLELKGDLVIAGDADITNAPNLTFNTPNDVSISSAAPDTSSKGWGVITQDSTGTVTIDTTINNIDANTVVINSGTLMLGDDNQIANTTNMVLNGGTFNTNNNDEILGTLTLTADSTIDFGNLPLDGSILKFADSSGETWDPDATLTIINWDGIPTTGNGIDQLFFGTDGNGLTETQRAQIFWSDNGLQQTLHLSDGEVVPVPEPGAIAAALGLTALIGWRERKRIVAIVHLLNRPIKSSHR